MDGKREERSGCAVIAIAGVLALPVLYVLSAGPAIWLATRGWLPMDAMAVYYPIEFVANTWPAVGEFIERYVAPWRA